MMGKLNITDMEDEPELKRMDVERVIICLDFLYCHTQWALLTLPLHSLSGAKDAYFKHSQTMSKLLS